MNGTYYSIVSDNQPPSLIHNIVLVYKPVLRNHNYFFTVPVPTFDKLRFRFQLHILTIKSKDFKQNLEKNLAFLHSKLFTRKKLINFIKFIVKCV
jgi:hypothetical protein